MNLKKKNTIKKIAIVLFIVAVALTLESCRNSYRNSEFDRALNVFFITISQITNIVILGTLSLVFSIIGSTSPKHGYRVVGSICTGIFGFFTLISFQGVIGFHATNMMVYLIFLIEFAMLGIAIYFSVKKRIPRNSGATPVTNNTQTLDDIINEEDEIV